MEAHLLYLNEDGSYELEGSLDSITLPKNLNQSIRLRLATVGETDPTLALLLSVMAVLGGSFTLPVATSMWRVLVPDGDITASIAKALEQKFVKFLSASGAQHAAGTGSRRRSSSSAAGDAQNRWALQPGLRTLLGYAGSLSGPQKNMSACFQSMSALSV